MTEEDKFLDGAINYLKGAIVSMRNANGFEQLDSGYTPETYEETINTLIEGIQLYQVRQRRFRLDFKHEKELRHKV